MSKRDRERAEKKRQKNLPADFKKKSWTAQQRAQAQEVILEGLITGKSLASLVQRTDQDGTILRPDMPRFSTVMAWLDTDQEFARLYAIARDHQADALADQIVDVADDSDADPDANSRRVRVDARKWVASKLKPKRYGDHLDVSGEVRSQLDIVISAGNSLEARLERLARRQTPTQTIEVQPNGNPSRPIRSGTPDPSGPDRR